MITRVPLPTLLLAGALLLPGTALTPVSAQEAPETIGVIGTGDLGGALGQIWAAAGHTVIYGSRTPEDERVQELVEATGHGARAVTQEEAARLGDIVVLAVPGTVGEEVVASLGDLSGKVVLDPMNTAAFEDGYIVKPPWLGERSLSERVQELAPGASVVKALNTLNYRIMVNPEFGGGPVTVPVAGNDEEAKERVIRLVRDTGLEPLDVGPLGAARYLEEMLRLYIGFQIANPGQAFEYELRVRPEPPR